MATGAAGAACLALAACGSDGGTVSVSAPSTTASTGPSAGSSASSGATTPGSSGSSAGSAAPSGSGASAEADFAPGQCYDNTVNWKLTPCDQKHKLEITQVVTNDQYADDVQKRSVLRTWTCNNALGGYLGDPAGYFSLVLAQPVPTSADPKNAGRIVCAAAVTKNDDSGYDQITYPIKNLLKDKGYVDYRICTPERPSQSDSPKIVPCTEPHAAETIGGYVIGQANTPYPGEAATDKISLDKCKALAKTYLGGVERKDVVAASNHSGPGPWGRGTTLTACFVESTNGKFVKPLKDMKNQPLSKFQ
ncbi:hypothetical protein HJ588_08785 [Flexivirga sp. ID2601S]|uniref:Septum formation-related domain-containing protein n=1 Tax=Flexivirga aerilata TaxID=1656889 RepID=A0A849ALX5_9MICO|nr:septum formation family protein [Flexivirga aerilata]NNG39370.1 hypothetical protein [Flexivirga aerilata]